MKSPSQIEPDFTPEDLALVEEFETNVESHFAMHPNTSRISCSPREDSRIGRRHLSEAVRRMRAAGWLVTPKGSGLVIERPPPGEIETAVRLHAGAPASNLLELVSLIGATPVKAVFDVYLDDRGLSRLVTMCRLGVNFSPALRLLTSSVGAKHLSALFAKDVLTEMGCTPGEVRVTPFDGHMGRLLFLAGANIIAPGCSLNGIDTDERAFRTGDSGDLAAFDARWGAARPNS